MGYGRWNVPDLAYLASKYYNEVREACGDRRHVLDTSYCRHCKLMVALIEGAVDEIIEARPEAPPMVETNNLLDDIARIVRQECLAWAAGTHSAIQNLCGVIGNHVAREILKLKEPPPEKVKVDTLAGDTADYVRSWKRPSNWIEDADEIKRMLELGKTAQEWKELKDAAETETSTGD